jgi:hypothetical protein
MTIESFEQNIVNAFENRIKKLYSQISQLDMFFGNKNFIAECISANHKHCCRCGRMIFFCEINNQTHSNCKKINYKVNLCDDCAEEK